LNRHIDDDAKKNMTLRSLLICACIAMFAHTVCCTAQAGPNGGSVNRALFLLASDIQAPILNSAPVSTILNSVSPDGQLSSRAILLHGSSTSGTRNWLPEGVSTINEIGQFLIVPYTYDSQCCAVFISENDPLHFESVRIASGETTVLNCGLGSIQDDGAAACGTWNTSGPISTGTQWTDLGILAESRTSPDVASLPARRITLWNLADGRRIDLAIPKDDSEVAHVSTIIRSCCDFTTSCFLRRFKARSSWSIARSV
jgi:hypothetical protein